MESLSLHTIFLEQQLAQTNNAYYEKLQKELNQLFSKNKNELENPSPYWSNSPDFKRIQEQFLALLNRDSLTLTYSTISMGTQCST